MEVKIQRPVDPITGQDEPEKLATGVTSGHKNQSHKLNGTDGMNKID